MRPWHALIVLAFGLPAAAEAAETFTFVARAEITNRIVAPVAGSKTIIAQFSSGPIEVTYPGRKVVSKSQCATWPAPPGGSFTSNGACVVIDSDNSQYSVVVSCRLVDAKITINDCFGQLTGVSGVYQSKTGTVSWRSTIAADNKTLTSVGAGQWN